MSQKIIKSNFSIADNAPNILTQDLDKQIAYNKITKINTILDVYIFSSLSPKLKFDKNWQYIHYLSYAWGSLVNCHILRNYGALNYTCIDDAIAVFIFLGKEIIIFKHNLSV